MKKLFERFKAKTPIFFKRVQRLALTAIAIAGSVLALEATYSIELSSHLHKVAEWVLVAGTVAGGVARFAKDDE